MPTATATKLKTTRTSSSRKKTSSRTTTSRAKQTKGARKPQAQRAILNQKARSGDLSSWKDLGGTPASRGKKTRASRRVKALDATPSLRLGILLLLACALVTAFIGHTFETQATLAEVQAAQKENERLRLTNQRLRGAFDRMTGPEAVMPAATRLGLEEGVAYGPALTLD
ncbi:MAG: hypothetical protein AAGI52_16735 [Bacteroidota bacterium]